MTDTRDKCTFGGKIINSLKLNFIGCFIILKKKNLVKKFWKFLKPVFLRYWLKL